MKILFGGICLIQFQWKKNFFLQGQNVTKNNEIGLINSIHDFRNHLAAVGHSLSTIHCYCRSLEQLVEIIGNVHLTRITEKRLEEAIIELSIYSKNGTNRSPGTINRIKSAYRSFFKWCFESGRKFHNPAACLRMAKTDTQRTIPITANETACLLNTIRKSDNSCSPRDEALFATYAYTGIRRSEALALRIKDYDVNTSTLYLPRSKNGKKRLVPVPTVLSKMLEKHIRNLKQNTDIDTCFPLFAGRRHERPMSGRQALVRFNKWKVLAKIRKNLTIHSLRAGFATLLYHTSGDLLLVSRALGHCDIRATERYIESYVSAVRIAVEKMFS